MDIETAKDLLGRIAEKKSFDGIGLSSATPVSDSTSKKFYRNKAIKDVSKNLLLALGLGAAFRGSQGLTGLFKKEKPLTPYRTVELPISYPGKEEDEKVAYSEYSNSWYLPSMLIGTPLAAYGGWKAVDKLLDSQRKERSKDELADAKKDYEAAVLSAYKQAENNLTTDELLDSVYSQAKTKSASDLWDMTKGLGLTYALTAGPLGFMLVNNAMKKNSKRALLEKAMKERARRQAMRQPAELYAVPTPQSTEENE